MADKLSVQLEATNAVAANKDVDSFKNNLVAADATINKLASKAASLDPKLGQKMAVDFTIFERKAAQVQNQLNAISQTRIAGGQFDDLTRFAIKAENRAAVVRQELEQIRLIAETPAGSAMLKTLEADGKSLEAELVRIEGLQKSLSRATPAAAAGGHGGLGNLGSVIQSGGRIQGLGPIFRASGLYQYGVDEMIISAANTARVAAGISFASVAVVGGVAAAGLAIVEISKHIRSEAEKRLKIEEDIASAMNRQILAGQEIAKNFEKLVESQAHDRQFARFLQGGSVEDLQRRYDNLKRIQDLGGNTDVVTDKEGKTTAVESEASKLRVAEMLSIKAQIETVLQNTTDSANTAFASRFANFQKVQTDAAKAQEKAREEAVKFQKSVEEGTKKVEDLGKAWTSAFDTEFIKSAGDNPFTQFFARTKKEVDDLKEHLKGLNPELAAVALHMQAAGNANGLFALRLDTALQASDLRSDATSFRNGRQGRDQAANEKIAQFRREIAGGTYRNPDILTEYRPGTSAQTALQLFDFQRRLEQSGGLFRNPLYDEDQRKRLAEAAGPSTVQERIDRQLKIIEQAGAVGDEQVSIANRKIIALTQGVNPAELSDTERNAAAKAREDEASRLTRSEDEAKKARVESDRIQKSIDSNIADLLAIAKSDGLTGVIRIINEADDRARDSLGQRSRSNDSNAADLMRQ